MMAEKRTTNLASDAFRKHYDILYSALASQPDLVLGLSAKLYKRVVITQDTRDSIQLTTGVTPGYQASRLLQAVEANIRINPRNLRQFSRVLKKEPTLKRISEALRDCYRTLVSVAGQVLSSSSESETELTDHQTSASEVGTDGVQNGAVQTEDLENRCVDVVYKNVAVQIEEFENRFEDLAFRAQDAIEEKHTPVKRFRHTLTLLPLSIKPDHLQFLNKELANIEKAENVDTIFHHLNLYWNFIDYHLLEHVIKKYGCHSLKEDMRKYAFDLAEFRRKTTIAQVHKAAKSWCPRPDLPQHFSRLSTKFSKKASEYTLEELEQFRLLFCREFSLSEFTAMIASATPGSVIIVWHVPSSLICNLRAAILSHPRSFFEQQLVVRIELDGVCVYDEKVLPSLPIHQQEVGIEGNLLFYHTCSSLTNQVAGFEVSKSLIPHYIIYNENNWLKSIDYIGS